VLEQIAHLMFVKLLDNNQLKAEIIGIAFKKEIIML